jgi:hypothetical protein
LLFFSLFPQLPESSSTVSNTFYIWICIWSCLFLWIFLSLDLFSMYVRKHADRCFWSVLLHLTWCPPAASIYLQTTCNSLWLNNTILYIYVNLLIY